jgi:ABC-2 type transport system ATP-binding protein
MSETFAVSLSGVTKQYRRSHLGRSRVSRGVEDVALEIRPGEVFGLLGPNGSGKTTTLKLILGLLFPDRGDVRVEGLPAQAPEARRRLGYLPEVPYFSRHLSAREVLRFHGRLSGLAGAALERRIDESLHRVRMTPHADRRLKEYSKGMLQRTGLAQAVIADPAVLVLDEPVTGLDPLGLREMREFIATLNAAGKTVLFSSHSISEVERLCHRVGIMVKGRLARTASREEWMSADGALERLFVETVGDPEVA